MNIEPRGDSAIYTSDAVRNILGAALVPTPILPTRNGSAGSAARKHWESTGQEMDSGGQSLT
jgi:hypothetical protein